MIVFVDTSAVIAMMLADDPHHATAVDEFAGFAAGTRLVTHEYVVVESIAVLQRRVGMDAVRVFLGEVVPAMTVRWIDPDAHLAARTALLAADQRGVSFVDQVSFAVMRDEGLTSAFAFDDDFADAGFEVIPG